MKNLVKTKSLIFFKKIYLEKFQTFLEHMKSAALKQSRMTIICLKHQNKGGPYIFTHNLKL